MSFIKTLINESLEKAGVSRTKFAKDLQISKSFVLGVLQGQKKVSENMYRRLLTLDYIPREAKREMKTAYYTDLFGKEEYDNICCFLSCARHFEESIRPIPISSEIMKTPLPADGAITDKKTLLKAALSLFEEAKANHQTVYSNFPFEETELNNLLFSFCRERDGIKAVDFVHCIYIPPTVNRLSIATYWQALRWGFAGIETTVWAMSQNGGAFPWCIITGDAVLLFSDGISHGILVKNKELARISREVFVSNTENAFPMAKIIMDETVMLSNLSGVSECINFALDSTLCPETLFDFDMLYPSSSEKMPDRTRRMLTEAFVNYYNQMGSRVADCLTAYEALEFWAHTGELLTVSKRYLNPLPPNVREEALKRFLNKCLSGRGKVLRKGCSKLPAGYNLNVSEKLTETHLLFRGDINTPYEIYVPMQTKQINGLHDFCKNLYAYCRDDTDVYTDEEIRFLTEQMMILCRYSADTPQDSANQ